MVMNDRRYLGFVLQDRADGMVLRELFARHVSANEVGKHEIICHLAFASIQTTSSNSRSLSQSV